VNVSHDDLYTKWWNYVECAPYLRRIEFQTSASITARSPFVSPLIVADNVVAERADYSNDLFFGDLVPSTDDRQGPLCLCAERRYGQGRVILFGDSTIWSNFSFYSASNERLFASLIAIRGRGVGMAVVLLFYLSLSGVLIGVVKRIAPQLLQLPVRNAACWSISLAAVLAVSVMACESGQCGWEPALPHDGLNRVTLDTRNSQVQLRADIRRGTDSDLEDYSTFYAWLSRAGWSPQCVDDYEYEDCHVPTLMVNPAAPIVHATVERIRAYLNSGGRLLVLFDPGMVKPDVVRSLLTPFDVRVEPVRDATALFDANGPDLQSNPLSLPFDILSGDYAGKGARRADGGNLAYALAGVTPLLVESSGIVIAGEKRVGNGKITIFSRSVLFSEFVFGDVWGGKEPSHEKRQLYQLAYDLVDHALAD
jgi:hypothetical protein